MKIAFLVLLFKCSLGQNSNEDEVAFWENIITTGREEVFNYEMPTDNEQYRPHNSRHTKAFGQWDFIIVGAGCGGAVVANRLSEVSRWKVLLLEAGGQESNFSIIPANVPYLLISKFNWGYYSTQQNLSCLGMSENRCPMARGRGLGGSSIINYELYVRGNKDDFDDWAAQGNPGWTYQEVLPYFIKSENSQVQSDSGYHGKSGYWNVKNVNPLNNQSAAFLEGSSTLYNSTSTDYNGRNQLGAFRVQVNNRRQFRHSTNSAFLKPITERKNLKILTNAFVTKVLIGRGRERVHGVIFSRNGKQYCARASKEVILSAGAINTPQLLILSGIGPREHLEQLKIPVVGNLPVGKTLYDHAVFQATYVGINESVPEISLHDHVVEFLNEYGFLTRYANSEVLGFYQSKFAISPNFPDIELAPYLIEESSEVFLVDYFKLKAETYDAIKASLTSPAHISINTFVVKTVSIGSVTLQSKNPYEFPLIDPNFLGEQFEVELLYEGIKTIKKIIDTEPLRKLNATLILVDYPQCKNHELGSKDYWICAFRLMTGSGYHQGGTCRMGPNPKTSVVNNKGIVHGFHNLRIVDVSIFPSMVAGHTAAPTVMMAEKISDDIKIQYGVPIERITNTIC